MRDFSRQEDLVPADKLAETPITVVGCGAIGRQVGIQLASIGARRIVLIDHDTVDASNVTTQGFKQTDIGEYKVSALARTMLEIDPSIVLSHSKSRWRKDIPLSPVTFVCVDSMDARKAIFKSFDGELLIDGRMAGEFCQVYPVTFTFDSRELYKETLFPQSEAHTGRCTSKSTIYCASFAAAAMVYQFTQWLRELPLETMEGGPGGFFEKSLQVAE